MARLFVFQIQTLTLYFFFLYRPFLTSLSYITLKQVALLRFDKDGKITYLEEYWHSVTTVTAQARRAADGGVEADDSGGNVVGGDGVGSDAEIAYDATSPSPPPTTTTTTPTTPTTVVSTAAATSVETSKEARAARNKRFKGGKRSKGGGGGGRGGGGGALVCYNCQQPGHMSAGCKVRLFICLFTFLSTSFAFVLCICCCPLYLLLSFLLAFVLFICFLCTCVL
jgi:hypothetical protein